MEEIEKKKKKRRKKPSQKRRLRKRQKNIALIACIAVVLVFLFIVRSWKTSENGVMGDEMSNISNSGPIAGPANESSETSEPNNQKGTGPDEIPIKTGIEALWYYEEARADRYVGFQAANPGLTEDEVCWMVGCNLDIPPYEETFELPDPNSILLLVNKYYYLPDGYEPEDLVSIGKTMMRKEAGEAMLEMIDAAAGEGHSIWSQSGYRSYAVQVKLFNDYSARDGQEAAESYSARPGHSEHQTGLTTDLNTITPAFGETPEGKWTAANCWQYGFIVRYTEENTQITHYIPEPWHMRYIGRDAARTMHDQGIMSFEEYWVKYVKHTP